MRKAGAIILLVLLASIAATAQKRKKPHAASRSKAAATSAAPTITGPRMVGSEVVIITKNDDRITGTLVDLTAYSVRIKADNLESTIALDRISSLSFGDGGSVSRAAPTAAPASGDFARAAAPVLKAFQAFAERLRQGTEFNEYGRLLTDLRRNGEQFINRYGASENSSEARIVALLSAALTDYSWARTIWTLRLNRSGDPTAYDTDVPAMTDALVLYPDLRTAAATGNKFTVDKVVSGLWKKAADKIERARALSGDAK